MDFRWAALVLAGAWCAAPGSAGAAPTAVVRVAYAADAGCPDRADFLAKVRARAPRVQIVADETGRRDVSVTIKAGPQGTVGRLEVRAPDGTATVREVRGASCEAVASAQALVAALTLDPDASLTGDDGTRSASLRVLGGSGDLDAAAPVPDVPNRPEGPSQDRVRWGIGASTGFVSALLPGVSATGSVFLDAHGTGSLVPVSLRLFAARVFPRERGYEWGHASIDAMLAGLQACPLRWSIHGSALGLRPCVAVEAGSLATSGTVTERGGQPGQDRRIWVDGTLGLRAEWSIGSSLQIELQGGAMFPLTRYRYTMALPNVAGSLTDSAIYEVPPVVGSASVAIAMHLP